MNSWIGILNGSTDVWVTDDSDQDTDDGGVPDRDEYFDGTNPENNPIDDLLPSDFDGDGIPDAVENQSGTDWTNPDTDGGGVIDGIECPQQFWLTNCVGSPTDPFDPSDDYLPSEVVFWANNSSGEVDLDKIHRWRVYTNDFYTGTSYAHIAEVHPFEAMVIPSSNETHLADVAFSNGTIEWFVKYQTSLQTGNLPVPNDLSNLSSLSTRQPHWSVQMIHTIFLSRQVQCRRYIQKLRNITSIGRYLQRLLYPEPIRHTN